METATTVTIVVVLVCILLIAIACCMCGKVCGIKCCEEDEMEDYEFEEVRKPSNSSYFVCVCFSC